MIKFISVLFILFPLYCSAINLQVLYDTGTAENLAENVNENLTVESVDPIEVERSRFPIVSAKWKQGEFKSKKVNFPNVRSPIFIVACDLTSRKWMEYRKNIITKKRILGFVVNCKSYEEYSRFKASIYPIVVQAVNLDILADHLNHGIYPAYIHANAIEQ